MEINRFALLASDAQIEQPCKHWKATTSIPLLLGNGAEARTALFKLIPAHAEVFSSSSITL